MMMILTIFVLWLLFRPRRYYPMRMHRPIHFGGMYGRSMFGPRPHHGFMRMNGHHPYGGFRPMGGPRGPRF